MATTVTSRSSGAWVRIAFAMFAVGWGANQFSPMLIVYRHDLRLSAGAVAGLFLVYALTLIPGLLVGGPASAASAGGFGLGPVVAASLAQWASDPLVLPYLPHLLIGAVAVVALAWIPVGAAAGRTVPCLATPERRGAGASRRWPPAAVRTPRFWLAVAPASPLVFGSVSLAIVVLPEEVTSARSLSAGFAGLMTALSFSAGVAVQPLARRMRDMLTGGVAGMGCATAGTAIGIAAVAGSDRVVAGAAAVLLGLPYGLCLVSGLRQAEHLANPDERGAVIACYYALAYLGFAAPYLVDGLGALAGKTGAFVALTAIIAALALWTAGYAASLRLAGRDTKSDTLVSWPPENRDPVSR